MNDGTPEARFTVLMAELETRFPTPPSEAVRSDVAPEQRYLAAIDALVAALTSWVDVMDKLSQDPDDPAVVFRNTYHGKRLEQSRAALAKVKP